MGIKEILESTDELIEDTKSRIIIIEDLEKTCQEDILASVVQLLADNKEILAELLSDKAAWENDPLLMKKD